MLQALSAELALMFLPQPRGEFVVRPAITAYETLTHSTGRAECLLLGSKADIAPWPRAKSSGHLLGPASASLRRLSGSRVTQDNLNAAV